VLAVVWGDLVVLLWAAAIGLIALGATLWARTAWDGVTIDASFEPSRAFIGEDVALQVRIANSKRFPLPIVRVTVRLPPGISAGRGAAEATSLRSFRRRLSIASRGEVTLRFPVLAPARGEYWLPSLGEYWLASLGGIDVELADPFDLVPLERSFDPDRPLLVLPESRFGFPLPVRRRLPFGVPAPSQRLFEDREHFAGVREYEPGDAMHHVHWRLSAHTGRLQTKRYEPTRSAEVVVALDLSHGEPFWRSIDRDTAEETIGLGGFLARQAIHAGWRTGLIANTHFSRARGPLRIPATSAPGSEAALFQALARMPNQPTGELGAVLREVGRRLTRSTTFVVVSPGPGPMLVREMEALRRKGSEVVHMPSPASEPA
jgi:uncharacterized protein (DUF58 family)